MSLLQSEEFAIYQLRTSYLAHIHDGIGERLINVDSSFLNDPAFRAAGWSPNAAEIKRTYSPPIPTSGTSEYFQAPPRSAGLPGQGLGEDEDDAAVTGNNAPHNIRKNSEDTVGPAPIARRNRRRKEQLEEDDSSDLSDESNDETEAQSRPANQIRFAKMPLRTRADSSPADKARAGLSPIPDDQRADGPSLFVTSPSRPPDSQRLRAGSLGAIDAEPVKTRSRGDTTTSSDMSSEGDLDPSVFRRRKQMQTSRSGMTLESHQEEDPDSTRPSTAASAAESIGRSEATSQDDRDRMDRSDDDDEGESDDDSLASGFSETVGSGSLLDRVAPIDSATLAPLKTPNTRGSSPRRDKKASTETLQELPPARPISTIQPVSALAAALKAKNKNPNSIFDRFAALSGDKAPECLWIKLYIPSSSNAEDPIQLQLRRTTNDGSPVSVAEAVGYGLLRYTEEKYEPAITGSRLNVNKWVLRIIEDGEVDFDFPPLGRTAPISDFASNNNRPVRGRARDKPWDEFGLVEATDEQFKENERLTPSFSAEAAAASSSQQEERSLETIPSLPTTPVQQPAEPVPSPAKPAPSPQPQHERKPSQPLPRQAQNPITNPRYAFAAFRKDSSNALDTPAETAPTSQQRTGAPRTLTLHFTDASARTQVLALDVTTDTYISEAFDQACQRLNLDKALFVLKVTGTTTVAPTDRTVEALGARLDLDLARRRFVGEAGFGLSGSPGSSSPNAPLLLSTNMSPRAGGARRNRDRAALRGVVPAALAGPHPLAQHADPLGLVGLGPAAPGYRRYNVVRRQPMSFTPNQPRTLLLDSEYLHILPGEGAAGGTTGGKTHIVPFSSVIGVKVNRKHPKTFRVVVFRERESKRYDFEAAGSDEASQIVREIERGVAPFREAMGR